MGQEVSSKENEVVKSGGGAQVADAKEQPRSYNPTDSLPKSQVSSSLNSDAGKYKQGPGPI